MYATRQLSLLNGCYAGLGQSIGALIGGAMARKMGISKTFYACGVIDTVCLAIVATYQLIDIRKQHKEQQAQAQTQTQVQSGDESGGGKAIKQQ
jgi:hypothetical protein